MNEEFRVEYKHSANWLNAGHNITRSQAIKDYESRREEYKLGSRRCLKITEELVKFVTTVEIK